MLSRLLRVSAVASARSKLPRRERKVPLDDGRADPSYGGDRSIEKEATFIPMREDIKAHPLRPTDTSRYGDNAYLFRKETSDKYLDLLDPHKQIVQWPIERMAPIISPAAYVSASATVIGRVELYDYASIWPGATINASIKLIRIGAYANIQDNVTVTEEFGRLHEDHDGTTIIGNFVTVGHNCTLRACTIEDECMVGSGSVLASGSYMERHSILGANSVLLQHDRIPSGQVWAGNPAVYVRDITTKEITEIKRNAEFYAVLSKEHQREWYDEYPMGMYRQAAKEGIPVGFRTHDYQTQPEPEPAAQ